MRGPLWLGIVALGLLAGCGGDDDGGGGADAGGGGMDSGGGGLDSGGGGVDSGGGGVDSGGGGVDSGGGDVDSGGGDVDAGMMMGCVANGGSCLGEGALCCGGLECCSGVPEPAGTATCRAMCRNSDRNIKHGFASVDPEEVLEQVARLEVTTWSYDAEPGVRHMGPMAQDFAAAFEVGADNRHIHTVDMNGVSTAAIQALHARTERLAEENRELRRDNAELRAAVARIEAALR